MSVELAPRTSAKARTRSVKKRAKRKQKPALPLIDLFAGCGGFSEGFLSYSEGHHAYDLALAVDNNKDAHQTHLLRAIFHQFGTAPEDYYSLLRQQASFEELVEAYPAEASAARERVLQHELGAGLDSDELLHGLIDEKIGTIEDWVLIGGPPCQAYSSMGRSRNKGNQDYQAENDQRHFLYREYLKILARHWPSVFVMENVSGILNSKVNGGKIWHKILEDLADPVTALGLTEYDGLFDGYRLYSLVTPDRGLDIFGTPVLAPDEYVVRCEEYGIPQARHRVFILGVRSDIDVRPNQLSPTHQRIPCGSVLSDLAPLRSGLTRIEDSDENWLNLMRSLVKARWWERDEDYQPVLREARKALRKLVIPESGRGGQFVPWLTTDTSTIPDHLKAWLLDDQLGGICNHESKAHMESDVHRYVFAACHTNTNDRALRLVHFPEELLPAHENVRTADQETLSHSNFADRFAVQNADEPARTIVSHVAKDGHYNIHPDARQGRSLTVREVARIQTFPDNYFFPGARTQQYRQVGNAVPPYLARQIAELVDDIFVRSQR